MKEDKEKPSKLDSPEKSVGDDVQGTHRGGFGFWRMKRTTSAWSWVSQSFEYPLDIIFGVGGFLVPVFDLTVLLSLEGCFCSDRLGTDL